MNWWMWTIIATWACAISAMIYAIAIARLIIVNRRAHMMTMAALQSLGDTHMMGFEALAIDLDRLKHRFDELEKER